MMILGVKVITGSKVNSLEQLPGGSLKVRVSVPPEGGKANRMLIRLAAEHFGVKRSRIEIVRGAHRNNKLLKIKEDGELK